MQSLQVVSADLVQASPVVPPSVFAFSDSREFLKAWWGWKKSLKPTYSGASFASKAGFRAHNLFHLVASGKRNLSPDAIRSFCRGMDLETREALYFEKLVLFSQSKRSEDRQHYFNQLHALAPKGELGALSRIRDYSRYLRHWYGVAVRELVNLPDFSPEGEWISRRLKRKITPRQAREAWDAIVDLKMVEEDPERPGAWRISEQRVAIDSSSVDFVIRNFHREYLRRSEEAIDGESLEERDLSSLTLSIPRSELPVLRERIREFRRGLNREFPTRDLERDCVVAINSQLLVLTD